MSDPTKPGKPDQNPTDPGFWRRPLSSRMVWGLIVLAAVVLIAGIVLSVSMGIRLF